MVGFPSHLNTKEDYEYIRAHFDKAAWGPCFQRLLDTTKDWFFVSDLADGDEGVTDDTHQVIESEQDGTKTRAQYELRTNPTCELIRLGYTEDEVKAILA